MHYWRQTGENSARRYAYNEAVAAVTKGLALLATLPDSPARTQHELTMLLMLGDLLSATKGIVALEVREVFTQAHTLCHQVGEPRQRYQVLQGLYWCSLPQAQLHAAGELAQQLIDLAQRQHDKDLVLAGQAVVGVVATLRGELVVAQAHLEQYLSFADTTRSFASTVDRGHSLRVTHLTWMMQVLWELGSADQAQQRGAEALALAQQNGDPPSLAYAQFFGAVLTQYCRDAAATYACADALVAFATAQGLALRVEMGRIL